MEVILLDVARGGIEPLSFSVARLAAEIDLPRQRFSSTPTLTGRGERMRASGPVEREVRRYVEVDTGAPYSMIRSALNSSDGGIMRPRAFAVLRLMTK